MKSLLFSLVIFIIYDCNLGAQIFNCPFNQVKFEKIVGLRPAVEEPNFLLYQGENVPITLDCIQLCSQNKNCTSFLLHYNTSQCYYYSNTELPIQVYDYDNRPNTNVAWYRKTCNLNAMCSKSWVFESIFGADFIGYNNKNLGKMTRYNCMKKCVEETEFKCKSIKFYISDIRKFDSIGKCILSATDRHLIPNSFRVSRFENVYIENQCVNASSIDFCTYDEYYNTTLTHSDLLLKSLSDHQCRQKCDSLTPFNCRGYSTVPNDKSTDCILHSEDSKLVGPKLLTRSSGNYFEKARCLNITATCNDDYMMIVYKPEQPFAGRIYINGYSDMEPCYADGHYNATIVLTIPISQNVCGVTETRIGNTNGSIRSVLLVIQYNALIQTQVDRYVKIGCAIGQDTELTVGTNINITDSYPNKGTTVINNSTVLPKVTIRLIDYDTQQPTKDTNIGQTLQLIIEIQPNGPYDLWAGHLVAMSDDGQDSILLLDDNGCPTQSQIFQPFTKIMTNDSIKLVSTFQAFKFTSSNVVRFSVIVHFCTVTCPQLNCTIYNRIRRESYEFITSTDSYNYSNATVMPVNGTNINFTQTMPLNVLLIVRGTGAQSDQLILGKDTKIIIASSDWLTNEICVDYALFVGLAICWIILQIIILVCCFILIRKYKKYFDIAYTRYQDEQHFSETHQGFGLGGETLSRRVRWADQ